jgi:hypothetical protein
MRRNPCLAVTVAELTAAGIAHRVENGGRHPRVRWSFGGQNFTTVVPSTPSDVRAEANARGVIRRRLRQLGAITPHHGGAPKSGDGADKIQYPPTRRAAKTGGNSKSRSSIDMVTGAYSAVNGVKANSTIRAWRIGDPVAVPLERKPADMVCAELEGVLDRIVRLTPSSRDPAHFATEKSEIAWRLREVLRQLRLPFKQGVA